MFHALCRNFADALAGPGARARDPETWSMVYRAVDHADLNRRFRNHELLRRLPPSLERFAGLLVQYLEKRHAADYDPLSRFSQSEVLRDIGVAEAEIRTLQDTPARQRRAFAVQVLLGRRRG